MLRRGARYPIGSMPFSKLRPDTGSAAMLLTADPVPGQEP